MKYKIIALSSVIVALTIGLVITNLQNISVDEEDTTPVKVDDNLQDAVIKALKNEIIILGELTDNQKITFGLMENLLIKNDKIISILENQCNDTSFKEQSDDSGESLKT